MMHDPLAVAFEIRRPWPRRDSIRTPVKRRWEWRPWSPFATLAGRRYYFPALITVWHREPGGNDAFEICKHRTHWKWHAHHWHIQVPALQNLRRRLLTTCTWCGGPDRPSDRVNCSTGWNRETSPWWHGEKGLFHADCSAMPAAWRTCTCESPVLDRELSDSPHGDCANCGRWRRWRWTQTEIDRLRTLQRVPFGIRPDTVRFHPRRTHQGAPTVTEKHA